MTVYRKHDTGQTRLLVDSGAFTAWKSGTVIALDDYCKFIETLPVKPWRYFALDVVGDPAGTLRNYELMLKRGFKPVPIFTRGEDPSVLEDYYKTSDLVGIGGLVGTDDSRGFVNGIMQRIGSRHVHLLGFNRMEYLKFWKPYSADSSNHTGAHRYGRIDVYLGGGRFKAITRTQLSERLTHDISAKIRRYGFDPYVLRQQGEWHSGTSTSALVTKCAWVEFTLDIERALHTKFFLSESSNVYLGQIFKAFEIITGGKP